MSLIILSERLFLRIQKMPRLSWAKIEKYFQGSSKANASILMTKMI
jgi:hypothetical protein